MIDGRHQPLGQTPQSERHAGHSQAAQAPTLAVGDDEHAVMLDAA